MNPFNKKLDQAKKRQKRVYLVAGITILISLLIMMALFVVSQGTRVDVSPEDAKEHAGYTVTKGYGFFMGSTVYSFAGNISFTVSSPGFKKAVVSIDSARLDKVFSLELSELPGRLSVDISGDDDSLTKTAWRINNRDIALSDKLDIVLEAGLYMLTLDNPFFLQKEVTIEITRGELTKLQVALQPVRGQFNISSKPSGAMVFLDDKKAGSTPLQFDRNGGQYRLRLVLENYIETLEQLSITRADPKVIRNYKLELKKGRIRIELEPKGGTLLVNGIKRAEPLVLDATVEHHLNYMKPGFYSRSQTIRLAPGEEKKIRIQLKPEMGAVEIFSTPPATVWVGGKDLGVSPVRINLPAVAHNIIFKKKGFRSVVKQVKPQGGTVQKVSVSLLTEYQARLKEAPRQFTNKAGVKLKLFMVNDGMTMGAPRSEKGQRANEFQKKIRLTKPFYASLYEITNSQFAGFDPKRAMEPGDLPVTSVSWQEAAAFCNFLSAKEKILPFYKIENGMVKGFDARSDGYRLLSEGEWEWLARKSGKSVQTLFVWGDETIIPPKTANVADESARGKVRFFVPNYTDGYSGAAPVGSFDKETSGLYDMAGNVSEWVHDVYSILPPKKDTLALDPLGDQQGHAHVVKGASFGSGTITNLRPAFREGLTAGRDDLGFRIGRYLYGGKNE